MKKTTIITTVLSLAIIFNPPKSAFTKSDTKSKLSFLNKKVETVEPLPFRVFWIKTKDGSSYLATYNGRFVILSPEIIDVKTGKKITTIEALREAMKPDVNEFAALWLYKKGNPAALIVVDEYCPYCERLVKDILTILKTGKTPKYDLAVTFFPIHRQAVEASCKLFGAGPEKAREVYLKWVETQNPSVWSGLKCRPEDRKKLLFKAVQLRSMVGITATPTVILPSGQKIIGYKNPEEFLF